LKKSNEIKTRFTPSEEDIKGIRRGKIRRLKEPKTEGVPRLASKKNVRAALDADIEGLEELSKQLDLTQKKILNIILTDFGDRPESTIEPETATFMRLRSACARAGMLADKEKQAEFFRTIADPEFNRVVKTVGTGLIGMYVVPLMSKQIELAMGGSQAALDRLFEIVGIKQSKYDFYLQRVIANKTDINVEGDLNLEGKSDKELKELVGSFGDIADAEEVAG